MKARFEDSREIFNAFGLFKSTEAATIGVLWNKGVLRNSQASDLQLYHKRDSGTGVFLWILQNF